MKKISSVLLILALAALTAALALTAFSAEESSGTVYLSESGSDTQGNGSEASPYQTLEKALEEVPDGGTIHIVGKYTPQARFSWTPHGKTVVLTGGELNLSDWGSNGYFNIRDNVTFKDIQLTFAFLNWNGDSDSSKSSKGSSAYPRSYVFANGYHLVISEDVVFTNGEKSNVWLFGGSNGGTVEGDTCLEVYSGSFTFLFGGGNGGTVKGDTHLTVGGKVNPTADTSNHNANYNIYGGGWKDSVEGNTYLTVKDSAKAIYVRGGAYDVGGKIGGVTNVTLEGGTLMDLSGGSANTNTGRGANVTVTGGTVQQVFGGSYNASLGTDDSPANVNLRILGGRITRRIYGGCYNEYKKSGNNYVYTTSYHVTGRIVLTFGEKATLALSDTDQSIYARSRYKPVLSGEKTALVFLGDAARQKFKSKLGTNDLAGIFSGVMSGVSEADETHVCTYTVDGTTLKEACTLDGCRHTATAKLILDESLPLVYTGEPICPAKMEFDGSWKGDTGFAFTYENNINAGEATVTASNRLAKLTLSFTVKKAAYEKPELSKTDETLEGKTDGRIHGLTEAMEISTDGKNYQRVTDPDAFFAPGTYYVRLAADDNHTASESVKLTVQAGQPKPEETTQPPVTTGEKETTGAPETTRPGGEATPGSSASATEKAPDRESAAPSESAGGTGTPSVSETEDSTETSDNSGAEATAPGDSGEQTLPAGESAGEPAQTSPEDAGKEGNPGLLVLVVVLVLLAAGGAVTAILVVRKKRMAGKTLKEKDDK